MASILPLRGPILLLGGRSEIGVALAKRICKGRAVVLAQRDSSEDFGARDELLEAGATEVEILAWDAERLNELTDVYEVSERLVGQPFRIVIVAFGILGDQKLAERDPHEAYRIAMIDYAAQVATITAGAKYLERQPTGLLVAFSSIAGWRVRRANYVYGSAKAGLDGFLSGLIDATYGNRKFNVVLARPGFVIGRMTAGMSPTIMSSTADEVADAIVKGIERGRNKIWIPWRLQFIARIMPYVPQWIWRSLPR